MTLTEKVQQFKALQDKATPGGFRVIDYANDFGIEYTDSDFGIEYTDSDGDECMAAKFCTLEDATLFSAARNFPAGEVLKRLEELEVAFGIPT